MEKSERREHIESLVAEQRTMIFYEAPHKLPQTLRDLEKALGDREIAIVRELTKIYEQVIKTTLSAAAEKYSEETIKGEIVLIIKGAEKPEKVQMTLEQAAEYAELSGNGFEFEMNMLFSALEAKTPLSETAIPWKKGGFRFHPVVDTVRVYWAIFMESRTLKYVFSSGAAFLIDYIIFGILLKVFTVLFTALPFPIEAWSYLPATIGAWIVSSLTNFFMNRSFVFRSNVPIKIALPEYYGLAAVVFLMKTLILTLMIKVFRIPEMIAKLVAEVVFFR
jgi:putative flippase GtrA